MEFFPEIKELIEKFELKNDLTNNPNIWVGHAKIGFRKRLKINEAKEILSRYFEHHIPENMSIPSEWEKTINQWEDYLHFQKVREIDQPLFMKKKGKEAIVAVIWPWQIKEGVASLMLYKGKFIENNK